DAEDGIRYPLVTGVQTCALPIYQRRRVGQPRGAFRVRQGQHEDRPGRPVHDAAERGGIDRLAMGIHRRIAAARAWAHFVPGAGRSEERRVGEEFMTWRMALQ